MCGFGLEASIDDDQGGGEQHPTDQQRPLTDESPPLAEVSTDDQRAEDTQHGEYDDAEDMGAADFCRRDLDATREANTDAEEDRRQDIDQAANDQAHAETRGCGVENTSRCYGRGLLRLSDRRTQGRTSQAYRGLEKEPWVRRFRSEQQWAGQVVDRERPMSGARLPDQR